MKYTLVAKDSTTEIYMTEDGRYAIGILKDNSPRKLYRVLKREGGDLKTLATRCTYEVAKAIADTEMVGA